LQTRRHSEHCSLPDLNPEVTVILNQLLSEHVRLLGIFSNRIPEKDFLVIANQGLGNCSCRDRVIQVLPGPILELNPLLQEPRLRLNYYVDVDLLAWSKVQLAGLDLEGFLRIEQRYSPFSTNDRSRVVY